VESIEALAPMAGITNGAFCRKLSSYGFDLVTLGGYNADQPTIKAGHKILARGRPEFQVKEHELLSHLEEEAAMVKDQESWKGMVSVNLRAVSPEPIIEVSKLRNVDLVEINAHCRQPELIELGCGQAILRNPLELEDFTRKVVEKAKTPVSVKIRANVPGVNDLDVARAVENAGADYIHVDAMKPGFNRADHTIINKISSKTSIFLIGNNSILDLESAREMMAAGADGISIARAAMSGRLNFDLSLLDQ
jgi:TIM-barrel protein